MNRNAVLLAISLAFGAAITYVDSRPTWDDTGVTAAALLMISVALGILGPKRPWLWALALGLWIPLLGVIRTQNYGSILALVVTFAGAYGGMAIQRLLLPGRKKQ